MMMLVLQTLLIISFSRSLPPNFRNFGGEFPIDDSLTDSEDRRELFSFVEDMWDYTTGGGVADDARTTGAWAASTGEKAAHGTAKFFESTANDIEEKSTKLKGTLEKAAIDGVRAFENIPFDEVMEQIDAVLKKMCINFDKPDSCLTDIEARGCMPGDNECVITYGKNCLGISKELGGSLEMELNASEQRGSVELEAGLSVYGGANAVVSTQAVVELHINSSPKIRVFIEPPSVELDAQIRLQAEVSLTGESEEKRINLGPQIQIYKRVFMAGYVPVMVAIRAQPVAFMSTSGELHGSGEITYSAKGSISFADNLWLELDLETFRAKQNFDTVSAPTIEFEEGWEFELEANVDMTLTAKVGVELSVAVYDVVEINLLPLVVATVSANGEISVSGSGDTGGISSLSAEASGTAEVCLSGDFKGYLDWVDLSGNRRSGRGRGRRELMELQREQRRNLDQINFRNIIVDSCGMAVEAIAPHCVPAQEVLRGFCGLAMEGLELLGFPMYINVPSIDALRLPSLDLPQTCFTKSLDFGKEMSFDQAKEQGIECGGHFYGSTVGLASKFGNPAGDAWHTFVAGDSHMIIDACQSSYDSYIRLYRYEQYSEEYCVDIGVFGNVCIDIPQTRWSTITANDDHSGRCHSAAHVYASFLEVNNLVKGYTYALVVEGYGANEGSYKISLSCPDLKPSPVSETCSAGWTATNIISGNARDFEGTMGGWQCYDRNTGISHGNCHNHANFFGHSYSGHIHGWCTHTQGGIEQSFPTISGTQYKLTWQAYAGEWDGVDTDVMQVRIQNSDKSDWTEYSVTPNSWNVLELTFTANGAVTITMWADLNQCIDVDEIVLSQCGGCVQDVCGVCGGDGTSCLDCNGIPNGGAQMLACGCNDATSCLDCNGTPNGGAQMLACGCNDATSCLDCNGTPNGGAQMLACGCNDATSCLDCNGTPNGGAQMLACGCNDATSCLDCNGVPNGGAQILACGCNDATSCLDSCGVPNGDNSCGCNFQLGDGTGGSEDWVGYFVEQDCANECRRRGGYNGATTYASGGAGCWCERGMTGRSGTSYKSCMFSESGPNSNAALGCADITVRQPSSTINIAGVTWDTFNGCSGLDTNMWNCNELGMCRSGISKEACAQKCKESPDCGGFGYEMNSPNHCYLKPTLSASSLSQTAYIYCRDWAAQHGYVFHAKVCP